MMLYRPCGLEEMLLVWQSGLKRWPPRLPEQPIFYPVTNQGYAEQISRDWNTKSGTRMGYVTRFEVEDAYASRFERQVVGAREHEELWVPAEDLDVFNDHIIGTIEVVGLFVHSEAVGHVPSEGVFAGMGAREQLVWLESNKDTLVFEQAIVDASASVWLNWPMWQSSAFEMSDDVSGAIEERWDRSASIALPDVIARIA